MTQNLDQPEYDLVVVGGGPMGLATAWHASKQNKKVLVLERFLFFNNSGSSGDLVRMFRTMYTEDFMADLAVQSMACWTKLEEAAKQKLIEMTGLLNFGNPKYESGPEGNLLDPIKNLKRHGMKYQQLNAKELQTQFPFANLPDSYVGLYAPDNGVINVKRVVESLYNLCKENKCDLRENIRVVKVENTEKGVTVRTLMSQTDYGPFSEQSFTAKKCVITAGAYTNHILERSFNLSLNLDIWEMTYQYFSVSPSATAPCDPQAPEGTIERLEGKPFKCMWFQFENDSDPEDSDSSNLFYGFPSVPWAPDHTVRIALDHAARRITDPAKRARDVSQFDVQRTALFVQDRLPSLGNTAFPFFQGVCLQTNLPDNMFVLDYVPETNKNVVVFTGGWGFKFVPLIGEALASLCFPDTSPTLPYDISHFRIDRSGVINVEKKTCTASTDPQPAVLIQRYVAPSGSSMHRLIPPALSRRLEDFKINRDPSHNLVSLSSRRIEESASSNQVEKQEDAVDYRKIASHIWMKQHRSNHSESRLPNMNNNNENAHEMHFGPRMMSLAAVPSPQKEKGPIGKVAIIGAGVAGLYAGLILQSLGIDFKIIEAEKEHIGGRVRTHRFSKNPQTEAEFYDYSDLGAMRFPKIPTMNRVCDLVEKLNNENPPEYKIDWIPYFLTDKYENQLLYFNSVSLRKRIVEALKSDQALRFGQSQHGNVPDDFTKGHLYSEWVDLAFDHLLKAIRNDPTVGFHELMKYDNFSTRAYLSSFLTSEKHPDDEYLQKSATLVGRYPRSVVDWLETRDTGTGNYDKAFSEAILDALEFSACDWQCISGGTDRLVHGMVQKLGREKIQMSTEVYKIGHGSEETPVKLYLRKHQEKKEEQGEAQKVITHQEEEYNYVISTLPFSILRHIDTSSIGLSYEKRTAMRTLLYDHSTKVALRFKYRFWQQGPNPIFGGVTSTDLPARVIVYPSYGLDCKDASGVLLVSYTWGQDADRMGSLTKDRAVQVCLENLKTIHGKETVEAAIDERTLSEAVVWHWNTYENALGAFALYGPGQFRDLYHGAVRPEMKDHLHFCGEALSVRHAWIVGAFNSAYRSVYDIIKGDHELVEKMKSQWGEIGEEEWGK